MWGFASCQFELKICSSIRTNKLISCLICKNKPPFRFHYFVYSPTFFSPISFVRMEKRSTTNAPCWHLAMKLFTCVCSVALIVLYTLQPTTTTTQAASDKKLNETHLHADATLFLLSVQLFGIFRKMTHSTFISKLTCCKAWNGPII